MFQPNFKGWRDSSSRWTSLERRCGRTDRAQLSSPAMTTAGGLVFVGDTDRYMYAFDAASGKQLWKSPRMLTKMSGSPVTYTAMAGSMSRSSPASTRTTGFPPWRENSTVVHWPQAGSGVWVFAVKQ